MGSLKGNTRAVARVRVASACAPMDEILEDFDALQNYRMTFSTVYVCHEADSAGVVFVIGVVEPFGRDSPHGVPSLKTERLAESRHSYRGTCRRPSRIRTRAFEAA